MKSQFRIFFIFLIVALPHSSFSQDSLITKPSDKKFVVTPYLDFPIVYTEPGIQVQYFFNENHYFELKYGFDLFAYNISHDPYYGGGSVSNFFNGYGSIIKFGYGYLNNTGFKKNQRDAERKVKRNIHEFRVTYKDMFFPMYKVSDGTPGSSYTPIYSQSERKRTIVLNYVQGKKLNKLYKKEKFGIAFYLIAGLAYDIRYIRRYSVEFYVYPSEEINSPQITKASFRPSLGAEFIFYFKAYEKKF